MDKEGGWTTAATTLMTMIRLVIIPAMSLASQAVTAVAAVVTIGERGGGINVVLGRKGEAGRGGKEEGQHEQVEEEVKL